MLAKYFGGGGSFSIRVSAVKTVASEGQKDCQARDLLAQLEPQNEDQGFTQEVVLEVQLRV